MIPLGFSSSQINKYVIRVKQSFSDKLVGQLKLPLKMTLTSEIGSMKFELKTDSHIGDL